MAETVVSAFFSLFFKTLASEAMNKIARAEGIESDLEQLKTSLTQINSLLYDASQKEQTNEAVKDWLNGLHHLAYDIDDIFDELATEAIEHELTEKYGSIISKVRKLILTCCSNFSLSFRMHGKLDNIATNLQKLGDANKNLGLREKTNEKPRDKRFETSLVESGIVGREGDKKALVQKLLGGGESSNQNFTIVPIVGMGGVGKTTLARLLYDDDKVKGHFKVRAWVCVSDEFDCFTISSVIYQSVTGETKEFKDLNLLQEALRDKLTDKLFLIVLDDVWCESYDDWNKLERPFFVGAPGSRIIITTRKEQLLRQLGYAHIDPLSSLSHDDAMCLFSHHALGANNFDTHPTLRRYGEGLVRKCDGLPLALRSLGRLLRTKTDEEEWKELLDSEIWRLEKKDNVLPVLRLSYNDLSSSLKQLFAYCSLFPKDYVFDKDELILLWMAEGFLHQISTTSRSMERLGLKYFEELLSRSFFQRSPDDGSLFVMHDLLNDLAMSVAGDFFARLDVGKKNEALQKHRHVSLVCEKHMGHERFEPLIGAKSLRTFLALSAGVVESWDIFYLSNKVLNDLLQELPLLRVLSLSHLGISEVPEVVGDMKYLRYLNLSQTPITHLPENVCNLYNLQTLIVFGCHKLIKLPKNFSKLQNLQHFDFRGTRRLENMPLGIDELKNLQTLSKITVGGENGFLITELKNLQNLHGEVSISGLDNVQNALDAREANLPQKRLSVLELDWGGNEFGLSQSETHQEILNELKPKNDTLKQLRIKSYRGIEFPNWVGDPSFLRLTKVSLDGCEECTSLPPLGELPSLKKLFISNMHGVRVVGLEFLGTGLAFPSLQILSFKNMRGWQVWSTTSSDAAFPCLNELWIDGCYNLVGISLEALPSLRVFKVTECGLCVLMSLVTVASISLTTLEINCIFELTNELWRSATEYLESVKVLRIERCNEIRYLWESEAVASRVLGNLTHLEVENCNNLEHCSCPNSVELLSIQDCDSITSVSFPTGGGGKKLKSLCVHNCKKISFQKEEETEVLIDSSMQSWSNLKSFIHLTSLLITECSSMESFPDHELPYLTSLTYLVIAKCTSMDDSFPRGLWPPKLSCLIIGGLKKPVSEWGPQNFPTSLTELTLCGRPYDDVRNFGQLSHLFPSSLTALFISEFEKVESVSMGLQHLTTLQHLIIHSCPKMIDLPERLLPSLLSLHIHECPNLKEKSTRGGTYWPLISHIPRLDTDDEYLQV